MPEKSEFRREEGLNWYVRALELMTGKPSSCLCFSRGVDWRVQPEFFACCSESFEAKAAVRRLACRKCAGFHRYEPGKPATKASSAGSARA